MYFIHMDSKYCVFVVYPVCVQELDRSWLTVCCHCVVWRSFTSVTSTLYHYSEFCPRMQSAALCQPLGLFYSTALNR